MLEQKIEDFRRDIRLAKSLARNKYANKNYYESMAHKLEKMLKFYEDLKNWNNSD